LFNLKSSRGIAISNSIFKKGVIKIQNCQLLSGESLGFSSNSVIGEDGGYCVVNINKNFFDRFDFRDNIFNCNVKFENNKFLNVPNFKYTKFKKGLSFLESKFAESNFKYEDYSKFRILKEEMSKRSNYREEWIFWRLEEKCLEKNAPKYIEKSKKDSSESGAKYISFKPYQTFCEKFFSLFHELISKRGTSFSRIIFSWLASILIFSVIYFFQNELSVQKLIEIALYLLSKSDEGGFFANTLHRIQYFFQNEFFIENLSISAQKSVQKSIEIALYFNKNDEGGFFLNLLYRI
jgi:hypothetical protein